MDRRSDLLQISRRFTLALLLAEALVLVQPVAAAEAGAPKVAAAGQPSATAGREAARWYTSTIAKDENGGFLIVHFWSKGSLFRSEAVIAGRSIVTIVDPTTYYIFERVLGTGVAIERSSVAMAQDESRGRPFGNELEDLIRSGGELVETKETLVGPVDIFRSTNDAGRRTVWMSTVPPRVPLHIENYDRATATTGGLDYVNWIYGPEIPDSFFEPDPRVALEKVTYQQYRKRLGREAVGPAPVLYRDLLHGHD